MSNTRAQRFSKDPVPTTATDAIKCIVNYVLTAIEGEESKLDDSRDNAFSAVDAVDAWTRAWGQWTIKHFSEENWLKEWQNVATIATVQGVRAADYAAERGHAGVIRKADFIDGGKFAARCCKRRFADDKLHPMACWCSDC